MSRCQKCGGADIYTRWHKSGYHCSYEQRRQESIHDDAPEHLHDHCCGCGFSWRRPPLDGGQT